MNYPKNQLDILTQQLRLPSPIELQPWLAKLIANPDSVVIIAIEKPLCDTGPHIGTAWLSYKERLKVRKALAAINASRTKHNQPTTSEMPCH